MTNSMGLKKKLLIGVLTAALCASTCAGGLLIKANAESADAADLVTATNGTTVTAAKSYTTTAFVRSKTRMSGVTLVITA